MVFYAVRDALHLPHFDKKYLIYLRILKWDGYMRRE